MVISCSIPRVDRDFKMVKLIAIVLLGLVAASSALPRAQRKVPGGGRIVGGTPAAPGELPHQIVLLRSGSLSCGGSILTPGVVVTAAHCTTGSVGNIRIRAGELNLNQNDGTEQELPVSRKVDHPQYNGNTFANDISLLFLNGEFTLNENVQAVVLPSSQQQTTGNIQVSGWGTTSSGGSISQVLRKVDIPVVSDADCRRAYPTETILDSMLCAGESGKDSCQGDSGGPLIALNGKYLAGIVSWGYGCADARYPGVNTEVSYFLDFINSNISK